MLDEHCHNYTPSEGTKWQSQIFGCQMLDPGRRNQEMSLNGQEKTNIGSIVRRNVFSLRTVSALDKREGKKPVSAEISPK